MAAAQRALQALVDGAWVQAPGDAVVTWCRWPEFRNAPAPDGGLESVDQLLSAVHPADRRALRRAAFADAFAPAAKRVPIRWVASDPAFVTVAVGVEILPGGERLVTLSLDAGVDALAHDPADLESFLFRAAHDLVSPVRRLAAFSRRLVELELSDPRAAETRTRIEACASLAYRRVDDLVALARLDAELPRQPVDLLPLIEQAAQGLTRTASIESSQENAPVLGHEASLRDLCSRLFAGLEELAGGPLSISVGGGAPVEVTAEVPDYPRQAGESLERGCEPFMGIDGGVEQATGLAFTVCGKVVQRHGGTLRFTRAGESALRVELVLPGPD
ncbi:hypothetical protein ABI59_07715 [Acidobacteria bacterium Mor1]|nr:hypothetical protein ABI59_07715 [Acidobacteria bacterium Mor1]